MEDAKLNLDTRNNCKKNVWIIVIGLIIGIALVVGLSVGLARVEDVEKEQDWLTYENYIQIKDGMTYTQVVQIFNGNEGTLDTSSSYGGYTLAYYTWSYNAKTVVIGFENGTVCAKSQFGL